ncbi:MAG TPA: cell envelope integrity protein CreD, partial [Longimicrobiales bacterium]|nr:cell envelope integrity protein CreD [Longimicrobiales bacterium]
RMQDQIQRGAATLRASQTLRLVVVVVLVLVLLIPVAMIGGLVQERQERRATAVAEVSSSWGNAQAITGPALVVPYTHRWTERTTGGQGEGQAVTRTAERTAVFLPERLEVRGRIESETLNRGIFSIPVYRLRATIEGEFARPRFTELGELGADVAAVSWDRARLAVGISDARAIQEETAVTWNGGRVAFLPGTAGLEDLGGGIQAAVPVGEGEDDDDERFAFSFPLALNGSGSLQVAPFGQNTVVELESDFPSPSFQGTWLPTERTVSDDGFRARWSIPFLGRNYPQAWTAGTAGRDMVRAIEASRFGVELVSGVDHYRMAERSVKYAAMFILLTFAAVWLVEVLAGVRVHPIQYLLLGAALCVFYLLELSLSEHLGFPVAYALASVAIVGMVASYSRVVLRRTGRAAVVGGGVALLYGYLYTLLMNEDYALLIGSVGLFLILGAVMFATRRVDWFAVGAERAAG